MIRPTLPLEPFAESRRLKLWTEIVLCCQAGRALPSDEQLMARLHDASTRDLERAFEELVAMFSLGMRRDRKTGARLVRVSTNGGGWTAWTPLPGRAAVRLAAE